MKRYLYSLILLAAIALPRSSSATASFGSDNAGNYAGLSDYVGVNRGTGYSSGFASSGSSTGTFLGSSGQIDTNGLSFGVTNNGSGTTSVSRGFPPSNSGSLDVGQMFRLQFQPGTVAAGGGFNVNLLSNVSFGTNIFLSYTTASPDYILRLTDLVSPTQINTRTVDTGIPFTANSLSMVYTQGTGSFTMALTPFGGQTTTLTQTSNGQPYYFYINVNSATLYFNNPIVAPEPGTWAILVVGMLTGVCHLRRCRA